MFLWPWISTELKNTANSQIRIWKIESVSFFFEFFSRTVLKLCWRWKNWAGNHSGAHQDKMPGKIPEEIKLDKTTESKYYKDTIPAQWTSFSAINARGKQSGAMCHFWSAIGFHGVRTFHPMQFQPLTVSTYCIFNRPQFRPKLILANGS